MGWKLDLGGGCTVACASQPRVRSLLVTIFGDLVSVHGGIVNLAGLIGVAASFGASERNVRTAVHRMGNEGMLERTKAGRTSHYRLSRQERERFATATQRIYSEEPYSDDRRWTIILIPDLDAERRNLLVREMSWLGFSRAGASVLLHVGDDRGGAETVLEELGMRDKVLVFRAEGITGSSRRQRQLLWDFAFANWDLGRAERRYSEFVAAFRPLERILERGAELQEREALLARILIIHEYRRALLHDPDLPAHVLPASWSGHQARAMCASIYRRLAARSAAAARECFTTPDGGRLPAAAPRFWRRFGGLRPSAAPAAAARKAA